MTKGDSPMRTPEENAFDEALDRVTAVPVDAQLRRAQVLGVAFLLALMAAGWALGGRTVRLEKDGRTVWEGSFASLVFKGPKGVK
jgi:hypothetical protein